MKKLIAQILILFSLITVNFAQEQDVFKQTFPASSVLKPTLKVKTARDLNYWKQPTLKNFWSWMPKLEFAVSGPIADSSYFTYEFFNPDGKLWFSQDSAPFSIEAGRYEVFQSEAVSSWTDKRSSILTGLFTFKITLKNSLQGTSKLFYEGKFKVNKEFAGTPHPDFKNEFLFYVDQDWTLPMAYLNFNPKGNEEAPMFQPSMWFRGDNRGKIKAYLFYNGKQVDNTETGGSTQGDYVFIEGDSESKFRWEKWTFHFFNARYFDNEGDNKNFHVFKKNPGNYEIKILLDDEIVRTVPFTVGADGKIVDNNVAKNNGMSGFGIVVPAKVIPVKEGAVNLLAYKTDAFYGNPLTGF
ncbi:MAG TPA: hypothetical protein PKY82_02870 [Pyrinomonadaceae bacterium]|nr:hypothetical protein [Pyrinomonadaceae bacterium]